MRIMETGNIWFFENGEISGSSDTRNAVISEIRVDFPLPSFPQELSVPNIVEQSNNIWMTNHLMMMPKSLNIGVEEASLEVSLMFS